MKFENHMILEFPSKSTNEAFARSAAEITEAAAIRRVNTTMGSYAARF